jgi:hypothetical protein
MWANRKRRSSLFLVIRMDKAVVYWTGPAQKGMGQAKVHSLLIQTDLDELPSK